jgi:hypothetical protein
MAVVAIIVLVLLMTLAGLLTRKKPPKAETQSFMGIRFDDPSLTPQQIMWDAAESCGKHFNNIFLRDKTQEIFDAEIEALKDENMLLRATQQIEDASPTTTAGPDRHRSEST